MQYLLYLIFRSSRTEPPDLIGIMRVTDDMIDSLVCPPPPSDPPVMSEEMISGLIVPAPGWSKSEFIVVIFLSLKLLTFFTILGKDIFSPDVESSPAPSSADPQAIGQISSSGKQTSRTSSFEIENLLKTAEQVNKNLIMNH